MKIYKFPVGINQTNCYFAVDEPTGKCVVIDPGDEAPRLLEKLHDKELKVEYIILTHAHFDHIMALDELRDATGAKVIMHKADCEIMNDPKKCLLVWAGVDEPCRPADIYVDEGDVITVGESSLKVIHTPGHTPGCICLISENDMFSGDTLFRDNIGRYDLFGGDWNTLEKSLKRLASMDENYKVYPGHGPTTTLKYEKENNYYMI